MDTEIPCNLNTITLEDDVHTAQIHKFLLPANSQFKLRWDIMIVCLAFYTSSITPFLMSFTPDTRSFVPIIIFNCVVDAIFICDLELSFFTTYFDKLGFEVTEQKQIIIHNLKGLSF